MYMDSSYYYSVYLSKKITSKSSKSTLRLFENYSNCLCRSDFFDNVHEKQKKYIQYRQYFDKIP